MRTSQADNRTSERMRQKILWVFMKFLLFVIKCYIVILSKALKLFYAIQVPNYRFVRIFSKTLIIKEIKRIYDA